VVILAVVESIETRGQGSVQVEQDGFESGQKCHMSVSPAPDASGNTLHGTG
jgi:hypothetical protein